MLILQTLNGRSLQRETIEYIERKRTISTNKYLIKYNKWLKTCVSNVFMFS
jgi:hypothetical protein